MSMTPMEEGRAVIKEQIKRELAEAVGSDMFWLFYCPCGLQYPKFKPPTGWIDRVRPARTSK